MKRLLIVAGVITTAGLTGGCSTMSKDECLAGAWGEKGYADGLAGYPPTRLGDHAEACAKYQVAPNPAAYESAREDGLRSYCAPERGWSEGRSGNPYYGVCRPQEEAAFLPAYHDGQRLYEVEQAAERAASALRAAEARLRDREDRLAAGERDLRSPGLSDEERQKIRDRIHEASREIRDARRNADEASDALDQAQSAVRRARRELGGRYPV